MGFGSFLKRIAASPFTATRAALHVARKVERGVMHAGNQAAKSLGPSAQARFLKGSLSARSKAPPPPKTPYDFAKLDAAPGLQDLLVDPTGDPKAVQGKITDNQRELFNRVFRPDEKKLLDAANSPTDARDAGLSAASGAGQAFTAQQRFAQSDLSTTGSRVSAGARRTMSRTQGLARALSRAQAGNSAASNRRDANIKLVTGITDMAQGISANAGKSGSEAARLQAQREARNAQNAAASEQTGVGITTSTAMLAIAFM